MMLIPSWLQRLREDSRFAWRVLFGAWGFLLLPALLVNLGEHNLMVHTDEPRRALVTLEMIYSGDYLVPTLLGEPYLNKPPLYNWIIAAFFHLTGEYTEWSLRLPVVLALLSVLTLLFVFVRRELDEPTAMLTVVAFATCHRVLFYDSFLGLIDLSFSGLVLLNFLLIYHWERHNRLWRLFLVTYLITALAFLMKGLPAGVFQALTLLTLFSYKRRFWELLRPPHFAGIALFFLIVGSYYLAYLERSPVSMWEVVQTLFHESSKRTIVRFGWQETFLFLFRFPWEVFLNFAPWTLLVFALLWKKNRQWVWEQPFLRYVILIGLVNSLVYWTSPETRPRYLFALVPLLFVVLAALTRRCLSDRPRWLRGTEGFLGFLGVVGVLMITVGPFWERGRNAPEQIDFWVLPFGVAGLGLLVLFWRWQEQRLLVFALLFTLTRLGYSHYFLPQRAFDLEHIKTGAVRVGEQTRGEELYVNGPWLLHDSSLFYLTQAREQIVQSGTPAEHPNAYFLVGSLPAEELLEGVYDQIDAVNRTQPVYLVRFRNPAAPSERAPSGMITN